MRIKVELEFSLPSTEATEPYVKFSPYCGRIDSELHRIIMHTIYLRLVHSLRDDAKTKTDLDQAEIKKDLLAWADTIESSDFKVSQVFVDYEKM